MNGLTCIDLFAGLGGFSEGARQAGARVLWAANHWQLAVDLHAANHPDTAHACQDLQQADFGAVPDHDLLLASPCCQGHTNARGKERPGADLSRATAWAVLAAAEAKRPRALLVENVREFAAWELYPIWRAGLERLGYTLTEVVVNAADLGVPQERERLIVMGTLGRRAIEVQQPSAAHVPVSAVLDFGAGKWSQVEKPGRADATLRRVENARRTFGDTFVMPYYKSGSGLTGRSMHRPLGTVTCKDRWAVVSGDRMRMLTVNEYRAAMGFPEGYALPETRHDAIKALGNAVCPAVSRWAVQQVQAHIGATA